jgi:YHS domain-containing protein
MIKVVVYLFLAVLIISVLRGVIGVIGKALSGLGAPEEARRTEPGASPGGELKRDPVCGTFVPAATSVKRTINGEVVHFCSETCSQKHLSKA